MTQPLNETFSDLQLSISICLDGIRPFDLHQSIMDTEKRLMLCTVGVNDKEFAELRWWSDNNA
jgi:hypothetical protein